MSENSCIHVCMSVNMFIFQATQAIELETLIPLQYGVTKLILVGDPEQLPPTVLSQVL
jgi:senataxin